MNRPPLQVKLRSTPRRTEVQIQLSWRGRLSGPAVARLIAALVLVLAATAVALPAHDELARNVLYALAGFLTGSRPRPRP
jgi:hypothetical protein